MTRSPILCVAVIGLAACAGPALRPPSAPAAPRGDALLILSGFGYGRGQADGFRSVAGRAASEGLDLYVPKYLSRRGLEPSRAALAAFVRAQHLDRYARVHVFAFIAGAWTLNPEAARGLLPNLASVVYDRSPYQERAPAIAVEALPLPAWLRYGSTIFDVARTPYPPLNDARVRVGLIVETRPTAFIRHHARDAIAGGTFDARCGAFGQPYDDCVFVAMSHDDLYGRFAELWPDVASFIHAARFTSRADRTPPSPERLAARLR